MRLKPRGRAVILIIDNYDSFVYNLDRYLREMGCRTRVVRNDAIAISEVERIAPSAIVLSPGPCTPTEAGVSVELVRSLSGSIPILGVCLGHQVIGAALGGRVVRAPAPVHGISCLVRHESTRLFEGLPNPFRAGRYHSLCVVENSLPQELRITARTDDGVVMAIEDSSRRVFGVQFHPESVLTESGHRLLANFLSIAGVAVTSNPPGDYIRTPLRNDGLENSSISGMPLHW
jgi:anthranilate synthase/aminodeoxychorismate synthase-like glutamine amidotransferase